MAVFYLDFQGAIVSENYFYLYFTWVKLLIKNK